MTNQALIAVGSSGANMALALSGIAGLIGMIVGFIRSAKIVSKAEKCPKCGWPMHDAGWVELFSGAIDKDTHQQYHPIAVRVYKCAKCGIEKHIKTKKPEIKVGLHSYDPKIKKSSDPNHIAAYSRMPLNYKRLKSSEYNEIVDTANELVSIANQSYYNAVNGVAG